MDDVKTVKVRMHISERVHYDQIVDMKEDDAARLKEAIEIGDQLEIDWLAEYYINREDPTVKTAEFEVSDIYPCTKGGTRL